VSPKAKELKTIYLKLYCEDRSSHWSSSRDSTVVTAVAWVHSLAWELPHAVGVAHQKRFLKTKRGNKNKVPGT